LINTNPLVSVIVNCRNGQTFLDACIKSVLNQTYKNFELIFFDNLSTDMSNEIISKYKDNRIKKFSSAKYLSLPEARNAAIKKSQGKYIAILDTDDLASYNRLEVQVNFMISNKNYGLISSNCKFINDKDKILKFTNLPTAFKEIKDKIFWSYPFNNPTLFFRRKVFDEIGGYPENYQFINDYALAFKFFEISKVANLKNDLGSYRVHKSNLTSKYPLIMEKELFRFLLTLLFKKNNCSRLQTSYFILKCFFRIIFKILK
jgi:glycosyltransferase involved in cell wall biosynthesis